MWFHFPTPPRGVLLLSVLTVVRRHLPRHSVHRLPPPKYPRNVHVVFDMATSERNPQTQPTAVGQNNSTLLTEKAELDHGEKTHALQRVGSEQLEDELPEFHWRTVSCRYGHLRFMMLDTNLSRCGQKQWVAVAACFLLKSVATCCMR